MDELYEKYIIKRQLNLNKEQFVLFAEFFPALLVLLSDGILDSKEKSYLKKLSYNLSHTFLQDGYGTKKVKELEEIFNAEFEYLTLHIENWKEGYLNALRYHLEAYPESKATILESLRLFAHTSQDYNESESNMISYLAKELNLLNIKVSN